MSDLCSRCGMEYSECGCVAPLEPAPVPAAPDLNMLAQDIAESLMLAANYADGALLQEQFALIIAPNLYKVRAEREQELTQLRHHWNEALKGEDDALREGRKLQSEAARLRQALEQYGRHTVECPTAQGWGKPCTCGWEAARKALGGE